MYCTKCGTKQPEDAIYCAACGTRLIQEEKKEATEAGEEAKQELELPSAAPKVEPAEQTGRVLPSVMLTQNDPHSKGSGSRYPDPTKSFAARYGSLLALLCLAVLIAGGWYGWNHYKTGIGEQAAGLQTEANELARSGDYSAALIRLEKASKLLPEDLTIRTDLESLNMARQAQGELLQVVERINGSELDEAEQGLKRIEAELQKRSSALLTREKEAAAEQRSRLELLRTQKELESLDDVNALVSLLNEIEGVDTVEARDLIVEKIVAVSSRQAEQLLQEENYFAALRVVETALDYASANSELLGLNTRIETEKSEAEARREEAKAEDEAKRQAEKAEAEAKLQAEAEAAERRVIEQAAAQEQAEYTVQAFYDHLSMWNYSEAYALLGSSWQKNTGYSKFVEGYTNTYSVWIDSIDSVQGNENTEVTILITAEESTDMGTVYSRFRSVYQVGYENGMMKILSGKGEKLS